MSQNDLYCKIQVHGTGAMYIEGHLIDGTRLSGWVRVVADLPPDVALLPGESGDVEGPAENQGMDPGTLIPESMVDEVFHAGVISGEWRYTQGCALCETGPNFEPAKDLPNKSGDCTDFVYTAVKGALGDFWPHGPNQIVRTKGFNNYGARALSSYGYRQIDSARVRIGDIVVRTKTDPNSCLCGHAGIFYGWAAGGYPIALANNGYPATPSHPNVDAVTGRFDFKKKAGYVTKFFRPELP